MNEQQQIIDKIKILFDYRKIPWLLSHSQIENQRLFTEKLVRLQLAIYELDKHLESYWLIDIPDLKPYWVNIYERLADVGLSANQQRTWTQEIVRYQTRELALRRGISPTKHDIEDLYNFKSCDVRLIRRLIYRADVSLNALLKFSEWTEFDLITEVNDDLEDLYEDLTAFNGNRFLFSLCELGIEATRDRYENFLTKKWSSAGVRLDSSSTRYKDEMKGWLAVIVPQTRNLLDERLTACRLDVICNAEVIHFFNQVSAGSPQEDL